jgi:xanthine dehydrogenase accessory factor
VVPRLVDLVSCSAVADDLLELASELRRCGEPFALATVVRCEPPTSAKPGAKALVRADGSVSGWVGGACAEPVVVREALSALRDGRPRLVGLIGEGRRGPGRTEGLLEYPMSCHSGGTLEIYVEPYLPKRRLVIVGQGPVVETLATLAGAVEHSVVVLREGAVPSGLGRLDLAGAAVVVATHGNFDEDALARVLTSQAGYVSLVASRRRAAAIVESLRQRGVPSEHLARLKAPAGVDIGASTPEEIAVSILAEIIQHHRSAKSLPGVAAEPSGRDPICGMLVPLATAKYGSQARGHRVYFCSRHCQETFDHDPERYLAGAGG